MSKRALVIGLAASALLHALAGALLYVGAPSSQDEDDTAPLLVDFDINEAPEPEEAQMPEEVETEPAEIPEIPEPAEPAAVEEQPEQAAEPEEPESSEVAEVPVDAGVPDAAAVALNDAGPADAMLAQAGDAGRDAAAVAASDEAAIRDAGTGNDAAAVAGDTARDAGTTLAGGPRRAGTEANLLAYFPRGEVIALMIRFDRLRNTPWAEQTEAVLAPMPDHRSLIGHRDVSITTLFDTLIISSSEPSEVTATTLVGHTRMKGPEVRAFLDHPRARVAWSTARGGPLGRRQRSPLVHPDDRRVFLMPFPGWVVLSQPRHLGPLVQTAEGDIDMATAKSSDLPQWLTVIPGIETESGQAAPGTAEAANERGPALLVTVAGLLPPRVEVPSIGAIDTPQRLTLALEVAPTGFHVRGTMLFASPEQAGAFLAAAERARREFVDARIGKVVLSRFHAYNALRGLSLKQNRARVAFATSISVADARAMMDMAARWSRRFYAPPPSAPPDAPKAPQPRESSSETRDAPGTSDGTRPEDKASLPQTTGDDRRRPETTEDDQR